MIEREVKYSKERIIEEVKASLSFLEQSMDMLSYSEWQHDMDILNKLADLETEIEDAISFLSLQ